MPSMFAEEWRPIAGFYHWQVSDRGQVKNDFSGYVVKPYVKGGDVYVELTNSEGIYIEVGLAVILVTSFPEKQA